jgi:hypothetical protein
MDIDLRSATRLRSIHPPSQSSQHAIDHALAILSNVHVCRHSLRLGIREMVAGRRRHSRLIRDSTAHCEFLPSHDRRQHTFDHQGTTTAEGRCRTQKDSGEGDADARARQGLENRRCVRASVGQADGAGVCVRLYATLARVYRYDLSASARSSAGLVIRHMGVHLRVILPFDKPRTIKRYQTILHNFIFYATTRPPNFQA